MHIYNFVKISQFVLEIMRGNENLALFKGHNSDTNVRKMTCNNPKLDLVNMNAYIVYNIMLYILMGVIAYWNFQIKHLSSIKFGENLSICSQYIERKRNFGVNQGPYL